jgi:hypothetical protein
VTRILTVGYGAASYVVFLAAILYSIGFVGNFVVPRSIDNGVDAPVGAAVVVTCRRPNSAPSAAAGIHHCVLGDADDDGRPSAVRRRNNRLHADRNSIGGTRSQSDTRRTLSGLPQPRPMLIPGLRRARVR